MMKCDVLIIGGGLVGSSLAAAIASHPLGKSLDVVLIDPKLPSLQNWPTTSIRTSTITPSSKMFLDDIGVWSLLPETRVATFNDMFVWDHPKPLPRTVDTHDISRSPAGTIYFNAKEINEDVLGYVIDNDSMRYAIFSKLNQYTSSAEHNLSVIQGSVKTIDFGEDEDTHPHLTHEKNDEKATLTGGDEVAPWPIVQLDNDETIQTRLIVACDGSRSRVRTLCGADWFSQGYKQSAVVANVTLKDPITTAYQRFVSTGPVAILPVATEDTVNPVGNVIWTTTPAEAAALHAADDPVFLDELNVVLSAHEDEDIDLSATQTINVNQNIHARSDVELWNLMSKGLQVVLPSMGMVSDTGVSTVEPPQCTSQLGPRGHFPLTIGHAPRYVIHEKRTVLVGDAAHSVHPLAGQGVNLGFADARQVADCLAAAAGTGRDIGGEMGAPLMRYQAERMVANLGMMGVLHSLQRVFNQNSLSGFRALRRTGISMLNTASPIKRMILRAMR